MADGSEHVRVSGRGRAVQIEKRRYLPAVRSRHRDYDNRFVEFISGNPVNLTIQIGFTIGIAGIYYWMTSSMQDELDHLPYKISDEQANNKYQNFKSQFFGPMWWVVISSIIVRILYRLASASKLDSYLVLLLIIYYTASAGILNMYQQSLQIRLRRF